MVRLVHEREGELAQIDEIDVEPAGLLSLLSRPLGDREADPPLAHASHDDHQLRHVRGNLGAGHGISSDRILWLESIDLAPHRSAPGTASLRP